jgi:hypothetical protein
MANILTINEAANAVRTVTTDPVLSDLLPLIDDYIEGATGRNWAADATIHPKAKNAARMLLVREFEDPGGMAAGAALGFGLRSVLSQLEALALSYVEVEGLPGAGFIYLPRAQVGDQVGSVTGLTTALTGDQSALFETVISIAGYLQQVSDSDLEDYYFRVQIVALSERS